MSIRAQGGPSVFPECLLRAILRAMKLEDEELIVKRTDRQVNNSNPMQEVLPEIRGLLEGGNRERGDNAGLMQIVQQG